MASTTRFLAQQRADRIRQFHQELAQLEQDNVLQLALDDRQRLDAHHDALLNELSQSFDIDRDARSQQLSRGMRIASFIGALAFAASLFFLFRQFWGQFSETVQVIVLVGASLATFGLTATLHKRDASGYFTKLAAMVAFAAFVINIMLLGQIFNITPSDKAFLPWAAYALLLAYLCDLRLLLAAGLICLMVFMAARIGTWGGVYWLHFGERPENFLLPSILSFALPQILRHTRYDQFPMVYRLTGLLAFFLTLLVLAHWGRGSYLDWPVDLIEALYQVGGFLFSAGAVWLGLRRHWAESVNAGITFFVIFLYTKFYDWWWEAMPKYLFFLIIGLTSLLVLLVVKRLRRPTSPMAKGVA